ncbi:MAG: protoheme IX farnesyltransferase [Lautropia sp.]|nr:protoheme IX farnesyltransferase [Lautropia sp.]
MTLYVSEIRHRPFSQTARQYLQLTKPRVVLLAVFCAIIGMFLATDAMVPWTVLMSGTAGITLLAASGFVLNCLIERHVDAQMLRTAHRGSARGEISMGAGLVFATVLGCSGSLLLYLFVNPLTMWLTIATFVAYALVYTVLLKPRTPQNIVIGGASGAMPPVLGWAAVTNDVTAPALVLFLIIFVWTPPHFWSLALYRVEDYRRSCLPMLPVTHGSAFTRLNVLLYTVMLVVVTLLPYLIGMSGEFYLVSALVLGALFVRYAWQLWRRYSDALARKTFSFSVLYLALLFGALLIDHYL